MWDDRNCLSFETTVGGIEPQSPRLTVQRSTARPPLPTLLGAILNMYQLHFYAEFVQNNHPRNGHFKRLADFANLHNTDIRQGPQTSAPEISGHVTHWRRILSCYWAQTTVDFPIGGHVNVLSDYKETGLVILLNI